MTDTELTTLVPSWLTEPYVGAKELHWVCFAPPGWKQPIATVGLLLPECEMQIIDPLMPLPIINRPAVNKNQKYWLKAACKRAQEGNAFFHLGLDSAEDAKKWAARAVRLLDGYERVKLEDVVELLIGNRKICH